MSVLTIIVNILAYIVIVLLLLYIVIEIKFIVKNLPTNCSGDLNFDPTKNYIAKFNFPSIIQHLTKTTKIEGSLLGTKSSSTEGEFTIIFMSYSIDPTKQPSQQTFSGQKYVYNKETCSIAYTFYQPTDGSKGVEDYLKDNNIKLSEHANLVPNDGIRLTGSWEGPVSIPLAVTAYPGTL